MKEEKRDAEAGTPSYSAPILPKNVEELRQSVQPFAASGREKLLAFFMYLPAWLYLRSSWNDAAFYIFCALFIAMVEWRFWAEKRSAESWVWLGCLVVIAISEPLGRNRVWSDYRMLFLHAFAIYWVLSRSGRLFGGESGRFLPLDAFYGVVIFPFKHFFLRIRTVFYTLIHLHREEKKRSLSAILIVVLALGLALWLLLAALGELSGADETFGKAVSEILTALTSNWDPFTIELLLASLPVGAYLYGLIAGTARECRERVLARGEAVDAWVRSLRKVPCSVWTGVMTAFAAVYLAFFVLQAGYLFGAFTRTIPEGFTVAVYARRGFFSLCRVMAVNFALLWLVTRTGARPAREDKLTRIGCTLLLAQSILFAVIAASKLCLYIDTFGFTPRRLQSAWLIVVLAAGSAGAIHALWGGKKVFRSWMLFTGVTLALLHLW